MENKDEFIEALKELGFGDLSEDGNGVAYRRRLPTKILEICFYTCEDYLRLQTVESGHSLRLVGIQNIDQLKVFWHSITGNDLK